MTFVGHGNNGQNPVFTTVLVGAAVILVIVACIVVIRGKRG